MPGSDWAPRREEVGSESLPREQILGESPTTPVFQPGATLFLSLKPLLEEIQKKIWLEDQENQICSGGRVG